MAKKKRKIPNIFRFPIIGKYEDVPTKSTLEVTYFVDGTGNYNFALKDLPAVKLRGCRFQLKTSNVKTKKKFYENIKTLLNISSWSRDLDQPLPPVEEMPMLFGLLKLRKKKQRILVLIQSADCFFKSKVINIGAVILDNFIYLELMATLKNKA